MAHILLVCTANVCRSPFAEFTLRRELEPLGLTIASPGTHAVVGAQIDTAIARLAQTSGIPVEWITQHRAQRVSRELAREAGLILTLTREHRAAVAELVPERAHEIYTVRELAFLTRASTEVRTERSNVLPNLAFSPALSATRLADSDSDLAPRDDRTELLRTLARQQSSSRHALLQSGPQELDIEDPAGKPYSHYVSFARDLTPALSAISAAVRAVTE